MILQEKGDLLQSRANVIAHQVNCRGVMGAVWRNRLKRSYLLLNSINTIRIFVVSITLIHFLDTIIT